MASLWQQHPWAEFDLVLAVAHSVGFDLAEASAALGEMTKGRSSGKSMGRDSKDAAAREAAEGAEIASSTAAVCEAPLGEERSAVSRAAATEGAEAAVAEVVAPGAAAGTSSSEGGSDSEGDAYQRHRAPALKATHAWRKAVKR